VLHVRDADRVYETEVMRNNNGTAIRPPPYPTLNASWK
jgi:hypothetical protein